MLDLDAWETNLCLERQKIFLKKCQEKGKMGIKNSGSSWISLQKIAQPNKILQDLNEIVKFVDLQIIQ